MIAIHRTLMLHNNEIASLESSLDAIDSIREQVVAMGKVTRMQMTNVRACAMESATFDLPDLNNYTNMATKIGYQDSLESIGETTVNMIKKLVKFIIDSISSFFDWLLGLFKSKPKDVGEKFLAQYKAETTPPKTEPETETETEVADSKDKLEPAKPAPVAKLPLKESSRYSKAFESNPLLSHLTSESATNIFFDHILHGDGTLAFELFKSIMKDIEKVYTRKGVKTSDTTEYFDHQDYAIMRGEAISERTVKRLAVRYSGLESLVGIKLVAYDGDPEVKGLDRTKLVEDVKSNHDQVLQILNDHTKATGDSGTAAKIAFYYDKVNYGAKNVTAMCKSAVGAIQKESAKYTPGSTKHRLCSEHLKTLSIAKNIVISANFVDVAMLKALDAWISIRTDLKK